MSRVISRRTEVSVFEILGPIMVGPSSSHTAGAVRIGLITAKLLGERPSKAEITLSGSFAATGRGHGTDKALVAGLLGMEPDDMRIPESFEIANDRGFEFEFKNNEVKDAHPNTAIIAITGINGRNICVQAASIGGGRIKINKIDGIEVNFSGTLPTLIVNNIDEPGHVAAVAGTLSGSGFNIANMQLYRNKRGGTAVMVVEMDETLSEDMLKKLESMKGVLRVTYV